jgi:cystathionine beta-lyase/cystathionine gamma-synthase
LNQQCSDGMEGLEDLIKDFEEALEATNLKG